MWIVRANINNYTKIVNELKTNGCDEDGAIKLLTKAAEIKERTAYSWRNSCVIVSTVLQEIAV